MDIVPRRCNGRDSGTELASDKVLDLACFSVAVSGICKSRTVRCPEYTLARISNALVLSGLPLKSIRLSVFEPAKELKNSSHADTSASVSTEMLFFERSRSLSSPAARRMTGDRRVKDRVVKLLPARHISSSLAMIPSLWFAFRTDSSALATSARALSSSSLPETSRSIAGSLSAALCVGLEEIRFSYDLM